MQFPEHLKYSREHEWVAIDENRARIGITDYAQDALGDIVYVDLPEVGAVVLAAGVCVEVESTKSVSEIYAPVSGTILEANTALADTPELLNREPYEGGWIFVLELTDPSELDTLLDAVEYRNLVERG